MRFRGQIKSVENMPSGGFDFLVRWRRCRDGKENIENQGHTLVPDTRGHIRAA